MIYNFLIINQYRQKLKNEKLLKDQISEMQRKERLKLDYEEYLKYTQSEFESKIWYGNPENEIIEGTIKGIETNIHVYNNKKDNRKKGRKRRT